MKDEIKQMIDNLKFISEQESATIEINQNGCKVILDCITNLQETKINMEQELQELYLIKDNLQEENERLKKDNENLYSIICKNCGDIKTTDEEFESLKRVQGDDKSE